MNIAAQANNPTLQQGMLKWWHFTEGALLGCEAVTVAVALFAQLGKQAWMALPHQLTHSLKCWMCCRNTAR